MPTLKELNAQVGDVFTYSRGGAEWEVLEGKRLKRLEGGFVNNVAYPYWDTSKDWHLVVRAKSIKYGPWQVGLAITKPVNADWKALSDGWVAYRLPIKPVVLEREVFLGETHKSIHESGFDVFKTSKYCQNTHKITFNIVDGVPDCDSIRMTKL